jgi:ankyrin repeat protein
VNAGADIEAKDFYGYTSLIGASSGGNYEIVKFLVNAGADIETKNIHGCTPLLTAL